LRILPGLGTGLACRQLRLVPAGAAAGCSFSFCARLEAGRIQGEVDFRPPIGANADDRRAFGKIGQHLLVYWGGTGLD
jgi:hypothetical protein